MRTCEASWERALQGPNLITDVLSPERSESATWRRLKGGEFHFCRFFRHVVVFEISLFFLKNYFLVLCFQKFGSNEMSDIVSDVI